MLGIYLEKWRLSTTGSASFVDGNMSALAKQMFGPTRYLKSGISFTVLFLVTVIAALWVGRRYNPSAAILVATVAGAGFCITLESALIMPFFYLQYHNAQLFALFFVNLVALQILVNAAWWIFVGDRHPSAA
jgi:heme/copper-type cytochrome/quinol oxidase subunit 4